MQFEWVRNYPNFQGHSAAIDSSGNIYSVGDSSSYLIVLKHNPNGNLLWKRKLNYIKSNSPILVATDKNKDIYVSCSNIAHDYVLTKIDSFGQLKWENVLDYGGWDEPYSIAIDTIGYVYITGSTFNGITKCLTVKYTPQGDTLWTRINPDYIMSGKYISLDDSGYVYVAGYYTVPGVGDYFGTLKYNNNGNLKWFSKYRYQNKDSFGLCVKSDNKGNCFVSGWIYNNVNHISGLIKYDYKGDSIWVRTFADSSMPNLGTNMILDENGNIYLSSYFTLKYDTTGVLLWYKNNNDYNLYSFAYKNNSLYCAGWGPNNFLINELDTKGKLISQKYYPQTSFSHELMCFNNSVYLLTDAQDSLILIKFRTSPNSVANNANIFINYNLHQNFPNPFNSSTTIKYSLSANGIITLKVYDIKGKEITTLVNNSKTAGEYAERLTTDNFNLPTGVYFYSLYINNTLKKKKKLVVIK